MKRSSVPLSYSTLRRHVRAKVAREMAIVGASNMHADVDHCMTFSAGVNCHDVDPAYNSNVDDIGIDMPPVVQDDQNSDKGEDVAVSSFEHSETDDFYASDSSSDTDTDTGTDINIKLAQWANKYNISKAATHSLLSILNPHFPSLPRDPRTLLNTPTQTFVRNLKCGGQYCHMGLAKGLHMAVNAECHSLQHLELQINIDGLPLFKSSATCLWPIMALVRNMPTREPFVIGLYCGQEKPGDAAEFLSEFVSETPLLEPLPHAHTKLWSPYQALDHEI